MASSANTEAPPAAGASPAPKRLPVLLRRAWSSLNKGFRDRLEGLELTPFQFSVLRWLSEGPAKGLLQCALVELLSSDPNTVSSAISRMEKRGLIKRQRHHPDRRATRIRLRVAGRAKFAEACPIAAAHQAEVLAVLPTNGRQSFLESLAMIADACSAELRAVRAQPEA